MRATPFGCARACDSKELFSNLQLTQRLRFHPAMRDWGHTGLDCFASDGAWVIAGDKVSSMDGDLKARPFLEPHCRRPARNEVERTSKKMRGATGIPPFAKTNGREGRATRPRLSKSHSLLHKARGRPATRRKLRLHF